MELFVLLCAAPVVWSYGSGLVSESCFDMTPHHSGSPQTTKSLFTISTEQSSFTPGEDVKVSLQGSGSGSFRGFLLEAREPGGQSAVGSFLNVAVSHSSASPKTNIQVTWKPNPAETIKTVQFQASFVQSYRTFWVGVKSPVLSLNDSTRSSSTAAPSSDTISRTGCGASKLCFSQPSGCDPASSFQCYFMSARVLSPDGSGVRYEVTGSADGYVAFGFSDDQRMGNDDIYICGVDGQGGVGVQRAFSTGPTAPDVQPLGNVSDVKTRLQDGVLSCSFTSRNPISIQRSSSSKSYLLLAYGASSNGKIQMHQRAFSSSQKVDVSAPAVVQRDGKVQIIRAHGALMLMAWMTSAPLGMMGARLRTGVRGRKLFGRELWFLVHVSVMSITVATTIIAFILAFSFVSGWAAGAHSVLGCLVLILALIQPTLALMRCGPQHPWRFLFNWAHSFIAASLKLLAVAAIFTGVQMVDSSSDRWLMKVMGGFAAWEALLYGLLDLKGRWRKSRADGSDHLDSNTARADVLLLILYLAGNLSFLICLLTGIGQMSYP
ncbi:putative ferric-chelate reductase 1 isoform 2-T2 [Anableps anableps]